MTAVLDETPHQQHKRRAAHMARALTNDRVRAVMARLRERGWPGRWPRELMITHKGRD